MHKGRRLSIEQSGPTANKTIVMGILDRDLRQIRTKVVPNVKRETLQNEVLKQVKHGSTMW